MYNACLYAILSGLLFLPRRGSSRRHQRETFPPRCDVSRSDKLGALRVLPFDAAQFMTFVADDKRTKKGAGEYRDVCERDGLKARRPDRKMQPRLGERLGNVFALSREELHVFTPNTAMDYSDENTNRAICVFAVHRLI